MNISNRLWISLPNSIHSNHGLQIFHDDPDVIREFREFSRDTFGGVNTTKYGTFFQGLAEDWAYVEFWKSSDHAVLAMIREKAAELAVILEMELMEGEEGWDASKPEEPAERCRYDRVLDMLSEMGADSADDVRQCLVIVDGVETAPEDGVEFFCDLFDIEYLNFDGELAVAKLTAACSAEKLCVTRTLFEEGYAQVWVGPWEIWANPDGVHSIYCNDRKPIQGLSLEEAVSSVRAQILALVTAA